MSDLQIRGLIGKTEIYDYTAIGGYEYEIVYREGQPPCLVHERELRECRTCGGVGVVLRLTARKTIREVRCPDCDGTGRMR